MNSSIELKIFFITYKVLNEQSPSCLKDLIVSHYPSRALRSHSAAYCASWRLRGRADLFYGTTSFPATLHRIGGRALSYPTSLLSQSQTPSLILSFSFWKQSHFGLDQVTRTLLGHVTQLLILRTSPVLSLTCYMLWLHSLCFFHLPTVSALSVSALQANLLSV